MESKAAKGGIAKAREAYFSAADKALASEGLASDAPAGLRKLLSGKTPAKRTKTSKTAS